MTATVVGAFVLGGAGLAVACVLLFGHLRIFHPSISAVVIFPGAVDGLVVGAPVTFRGARMGSVTRISIEYDQTAHVAAIPVDLELEPYRVRVLREGGAVAAPLPELIALGLRAQLNTQSLVTGQAQIDLDFAADTPVVLHPGLTQLTEIPTRPSSFDQIRDAIGKLPLRELTDNAAATLLSLRSLSDRLNQEVPLLITSLIATSDKASTTMERLVVTIDGIHAQLGTTLSAIGAVAVTGDRELGQRGAELHTLLVSTNQMVAQARDVLGDAKGLTGNRAAARVNLESTLNDLAAAAAALRGLAGDVERNPQLLLTGRRP
jgi:paraquat-inducible protein B